MVELDPCLVLPASGRENVVRAVLTIQGLKLNLLFKDAIWRTCSAEIKILFAIFIFINVEVLVYFQRLWCFGQFISVVESQKEAEDSHNKENIGVLSEFILH